MRTSTAEVIDLQVYRAERQARLTPPPTRIGHPMEAQAVSIAWVPVWVMPVYFMAAQPVAATH